MSDQEGARVARVSPLHPALIEQTGADFDAAVLAKIEGWRTEYGDLEGRSLHDVWALMTRECRKYERRLQSSADTSAHDREKLVTMAAFAKLGWINNRPIGE